MKKLFPLFLILISCSGSSDLELAKSSLSEQMKAYIDAINSKNHRAQLDFLPEECLQGQSKENLAKQMQATEFLEFLPKFYLDTLYNIDTMITKDDKYYARLSNDMIVLHDYSRFDGENNAEFSVNAAVLELENHFGKENVLFDNETWIATCRAETIVFGYSESGQEWLIFGITPCTEKFIPNEIRQ